MKCEVLQVEGYKYERKGGQVVEGVQFALLDRDPVSPLINIFDLRLDGENLGKASALRGKTIEVDVKDFEIWSNRLRAQGSLTNTSAPVPKS